MGYPNTTASLAWPSLSATLAVGLLAFSPALAAHAQITDCDANGQDDATQFDLDGDGVINACDTCLTVPNPLQTDSDSDGYGNACDADLNGDAVVNVVDLGILRNRFFSTDADADLNTDGVVNVLDLAILRQSFFAAPGPGLPEADVTPDADLADIDGNIYATVRMGDQIWMRENLKTTTLNDGTPIPLYEIDEGWNPGFATENPLPRYQWADTSDLFQIFEEDLPFDFHGALYNNVALSLPGLCPAGWRLPSEQDFVDLIAFVDQDGFTGMSSEALKADLGWREESLGFDEYGFAGLPAGYASSQGTATGAGAIAAWATTRQDLDSFPLTRRVFSLEQFGGAARFWDNATRLGATVRCIKNNF
ncbi:MAG: FISUMP domain-containing protein [Gammaproteobacteria bacterium]